MKQSTNGQSFPNPYYKLLEKLKTPRGLALYAHLASLHVADKHKLSTRRSPGKYIPCKSNHNKSIKNTSIWSNKLLPALLRRFHTGPADAAFATELCYGSIRLKGLYDPFIQKVSNRQICQIDAVTRAILRLGCYEHFSLKTPSYALVNEMVALVKLVHPKSSGFVNAVLRKIVQVSNIPHKNLAQLYSHPEWIVSSYKNTLLRQGAVGDLPKALQANNIPPKVTYVILAGNRQSLLTQIRSAFPEAFFRECELSNIGFTSEGVDPQLVLRHFPSLRIQDEGSQLAALSLIYCSRLSQFAHCQSSETQELWLDMCAGPGGKTAVLAAYAPEQARIIATEINKNRAYMVRDAVAFTAPADTPAEVFTPSITLSAATGPGTPFKINRVTVINMDANLLPTSLARQQAQTSTASSTKSLLNRIMPIPHNPIKFDRILLDAPCSGIGSLRRRAELRWVKTPDSIGDITALQKRLFSSAAAALKPGGFLAYVTCSTDLQETVEQTQLAGEFTLQAIDSYHVISQFSQLPELCRIGTAVQLWPHITNTDGIFIALFQKPNPHRYNPSGRP